MPVEKSGQNEFDFEYGEDFGAHIERFDPDFSKVLVRFNTDGDADLNREQLERLKRLADWLHDHGRKFLFELLVPAEPAQLESVGGDSDRYDAELRPELMRRVIEETQNFGVDVDIWKIEGVDAREDAEMLARQSRVGNGREGVVCVLLGRSGARSGGTPSRASSTARSSARQLRGRSPTTICASSASTRRQRRSRPSRRSSQPASTPRGCHDADSITSGGLREGSE
jgi:hypothetical protein